MAEMGKKKYDGRQTELVMHERPKRTSLKGEEATAVRGKQGIEAYCELESETCNKTAWIPRGFFSSYSL